MPGKVMFFDGAMGTMLQHFGLKIGKSPELLNIERRDIVKRVHELYIEAGSDFITTNTFGANRFRFKDHMYSIVHIIDAALENAISSSKGRRIALDIGPTGLPGWEKGQINEHEIYDAFSESIIEGQKYSDAILIETMSHIKEAELAIRAARDNSQLPVYCTFSFMGDGKTFSGHDVSTVTRFLNNMGIDAMGINCSTGPVDMVDLIREMLRYSKIPVIARPNAGLPNIIDGKVVYEITPGEYAVRMKEIHDMGVSFLGGCCGTTPEHIRKMIEVIEN